MKNNYEFINIVKNYIDYKIKDKEDREVDILEYEQWLDNAAIYSDSISITTHPAKFVNSAIKWNSKKETANILIEKNINFKENINFFVNTLNLKQVDLDVHCNAAYLGYGAFFLLRNPVNNNHLIEEILLGNTDFLLAFTNNKQKVNKWAEAFTATTIPKRYFTSALAKQIYFPISENSYHLLSPMYASSLANYVYNKIKTVRFNDFYKDLRLKKRKGEFSEGVLIEYPNTALMHFGGAQPQNTSYLNSKRNGEMYLLSCKPPFWKKKPLKKNVNFKNFWEEFKNLNKKNIYRIQYFLSHTWKNNYETRKERAELFNVIYQNFIFFLCDLRNNQNNYYKIDLENLEFLKIFLASSIDLEKDDVENSLNITAKHFTKFLLNFLKIKKLDFGEDEIYQVQKEIKTELKEFLRSFS